MIVALSIRQPWTELILSGHKTIEVRSWPTKYRGELWLHAGKKTDINALARFNFSGKNISIGAILGKCELIDCVEFNDLTWEHWRTEHLNEGILTNKRFAWLLRNPVRVTPQPMKGKLGLMRIQDHAGQERL